MESNEKLAKSHVFFIHDGISQISGQTSLHTHHFWQLEIGGDGEIGVQLGRSKFTLTAGVGLLIPPSVPHQFVYPAATVRWATYKFTGPWPDTTGRVLDGDRHASSVIACLLGLARDHGGDSERRTRLAASLLDALVGYVVDASSQNPEAASSSAEVDPFLSAVESVLQRARGRPVRLEDVAEKLNLSPGHVSNTFRRKKGRSLKSRIDEVRASHAEEMLILTDLPVKLVAAEMGFPDVYAFSRFVKRHSGRSPRALRLEASRRKVPITLWKTTR
jgi:AraC-like DNA-binding protein